jgi:hypothetical protein
MRLDPRIIGGRVRSYVRFGLGLESLNTGISMPILTYTEMPKGTYLQLIPADGFGTLCGDQE